MKTTLPKRINIDRKWLVVDAKGQTLGRMATKIANVLRGKHKINFSPDVDTGDHVIILNTQDINLSSDKFQTKKYYSHSGYPGNLKTFSAEEVHKKDPTKIVVNAIKGMLPKNKLRQQMMRRLHVYADDQHKHEAQKPEALELS